MAGRYGIGARVRDEDGDEGVIVDKRKGERRVKYDEAAIGELWWPKSELALAGGWKVVGGTINAEDASIDFTDGKLTLRTDFCCAEKGEVAFAVGDRVVFTTEDTGHGAVYHDGVLTIDAVVDDGVSIVYPPFGQYADPPLTQVTTPDCLRHFTIETGRFYRTRDGRKVGPMERWDEDVEHSWQQVGESDFYSVGGDLWRDNGTSAYGMADIVAEWVEPAAPAEPWTDFDHWDTPPAKIVVEDATDPVFSFIVGDLAKTRNGVTVKIIEIDQSDAYPIVHDRGEDGYHACSPNGKSCIGEDEWDIVTAVTAVEPPPKFKVGDRVRIARNSRREDHLEREVGKECTIAYADGLGGVAGWSFDSSESFYWWPECDLELVTAPPLLIGQAVTASGYISGANGSNFSVVFGDRSYDLPATLLKKAA